MTKKYEERMAGAVKHLESEYSSVRAGRANPGVLDKVTVDYYGVPTPINQVATVSVTEARTLGAGVHSLVAGHTKAGAFANRILAALDCVVIVPSSLKWKPDTAGDVIEGVNESAAGIAAEYVKSRIGQQRYLRFISRQKNMLRNAKIVFPAKK